MRLYTFTDDSDNIIEEVRAEDHDDAVHKANAWNTKEELIHFFTDFYSVEITD